MSDAWDAVVVGSGLGGLAAAASLSRAGMRVLVVERHAQAGGYASTFRRGEFEFEVSLHLIDAIAHGAPNHALLDDLGIADRLELLTPRMLRRELWPERDIVVPHGETAYVSALAEHFPEARDGLDRLWSLAERVHEDYHRGGGASLAPLGALGRSTAADVIDRHVGDRGVRAGLELFGRGWLGLPLEELAAIQFLVPWYSYHRHGGSCPRGGSPSIVRALVGVVREHGGEVITSVGVERIHVERGRVRGVTLAGGRRIRAGVVVSNASPRHTLELLDSVDPRFRARVQRTEPSVSCVKVWLGLDSADDAWTDYDLYACDGEGGVLSITMPHVLTGGPIVVSLTSLVESGASVSRADGDRLVERAEQVLPGLTPRIVVKEVATPDTFERFTSNPGGSIYGARATVNQCGARRLPQATPYDGLWLAGAWTRPAAGFSAVLRSGLDAARAALQTARAA